MQHKKPHHPHRAVGPTVRVCWHRNPDKEPSRVPHNMTVDAVFPRTLATKTYSVIIDVVAGKLASDSCCLPAAEALFAPSYTGCGTKVVLIYKRWFRGLPLMQINCNAMCM